MNYCKFIVFTNKSKILLSTQTYSTLPFSIDIFDPAFLYTYIRPCLSPQIYSTLPFSIDIFQGRIQDFKLGGGAVKKNHAERREAQHFWGISCEKSRFYDKKIIFFPIAEGSAKIFGVFRVKNHDLTPKNHIFSNFRGGGALDPPLYMTIEENHN